MTSFVAINLFTVTPDKQHKLVEVMGQTITDDVASEGHPGVRNAFLYRSLDGSRVANITVWASKDDFDTAHSLPSFPKALSRLAGIADSADANTYELTFELIKPPPHEGVARHR
ncbi:antibiotic biosynthesis monooxygenase family protein [Streptomyces sp. AP-93]|uniref:antibiotic biosynthesis monooxygenase family protein n=1 Tax=Streptomyces sp. AP-93 TaxID=2929048 RepID=UPI001FAF8888|nr:antibiotic biosynthesis monooxygenase family protein [Streptomyces sp. AP-93]MCJ0872640.1 antibiotic biosynthesis monooxygenase [Streptomyces sp. AP-93]